MTGTGAPRGRPKKRGKIWNLRLIRASASEVGARDLADGTRDDVDAARSGAGRVRLCGVDDLVEEEEALASASSASTTTNARCSSRIRDRSRSQRRARLVSQGTGMFAGVVRNARQTHCVVMRMTSGDAVKFGARKY